MIFQTLDDKSECVGVYVDGKLWFDEPPSSLTKTWRYSGYIPPEEKVEYAWIYGNGLSLQEACPDHLLTRYEKIRKKIAAYKKSFDIAKVNLRHHCFFDLVPHDALLEFCEVKNQITEHVIEHNERPSNYDHMDKAYKLLFKIKQRDLNLNNEDCRNLFVQSGLRHASQKILNGPRHIDYNLFGTITGRLTTSPRSLPILTMKKELRRLIKPHHDWFVSLDYNGAEVRTLLALSGEEQPRGDIHEWNIVNVFKNTGMDRDTAKTTFFAWLYNPDADHISASYYNRQKVLDTYYDEGYINTVFDRHILVNEWKAFNYLIQSTTADLVIERAIAMDEFLQDKKSFVSHIVHDEIVLDFADEERHLIPEIKEMFANNQLGKFMVNLKAGKNYYDLENLDI